ncbi:hypothetical protein [Eggerthella sp. YY7918]|uniref:hypothetical protein n=1 Tax=Eggerthella sp. (strain YY7918) TaxID=502558 RepID=UPI00021717F1|nr:hypothetical protein [Eggerthella sp. YY7918]BAK43999.1 hypothetical protein EGYY_08040 [Eggerthella sp. YY7918]
MSKREPIIDIDPVESVRDKAKNAAKKTATTFQGPSYGNAAKAAKTVASDVAHAAVIDNKTTKKPRRLAGAVQTAVGGAVMLVGVPMLILPGPGLLAIGGGAVIAAGGIKKLVGK